MRGEIKFIRMALRNLRRKELQMLVKHVKAGTPILAGKMSGEWEFKGVY